MLKLLALLPFLTYGEWFFRTYEFDAIYPFDATRAAIASAEVPGLAEQEVTMADGTMLVLWVRTADPGRATVLYLPGNSGNLLGRAERFRDLVAQGYGVVALSWRGQGGSGGKPDEEHLSADGLAVYDLFVALHPVVWGESLGTAVAVKIAAARPLRGLVLESPFTSIPDLAQVQYPDEDLARYITQTWDSYSLIGRVEAPLLVMHGTDDRLVPLAQGEAMFAAAHSADKWLLRLDHRGHDGVWSEPAQLALYGFLDRF